MAAAFNGCSLIDEDLHNCGKECKIEYELRLVTNMTTEINTQLDIITDLQVSDALKNYLSNIFTDYAHDIDLSFYDVKEDSLRLHHENHIMDGSQTSYTLHIPVRHYMHTAAANVLENGTVKLDGDERCHTARFLQEASDTIGVHRTGLFSARLPMNVEEGIDQTFNVRLYMANCAAALVVTNEQCPKMRDMRVVTTGFASGFALADSVYHFNGSSVIRADRLDLPGMEKLCFVSVNFPSRDPLPTRSYIETEEPFKGSGTGETLWEIQAYVTLEDGTVTRTVFSLDEPLRAGEFRILRARTRGDGGLAPFDSKVGVSVELGWRNVNYGDINL